MADAERLVQRIEEPWPWQTGGAIVRRLDRALEASVPRAARAMELGERDWGWARRAVSVAFTVSRVMHMAGVAAPIRHVAAHAALGAGLLGYTQIPELSFDDAARAILERALADPDPASGGVPGHRLRVLAILERIVTPATDRPVPTANLIRLIYDLEQQRYDETADFTLTCGDLLPRAVRLAKRRKDTFTARMLLHALGAIPAGARVRLADGRLGHAMGEGDGGDPFRPLVMVDGNLITPGAPVRLASGAES